MSKSNQTKQPQCKLGGCRKTPEFPVEAPRYCGKHIDQAAAYEAKRAECVEKMRLAKLGKRSVKPSFASLSTIEIPMAHAPAFEVKKYSLWQRFKKWAFVQK